VTLLINLLHSEPRLFLTDHSRLLWCRRVVEREWRIAAVQVVVDIDVVRDVDVDIVHNTGSAIHAGNSKTRVEVLVILFEPLDFVPRPINGETKVLILFLEALELIFIRDQLEPSVPVLLPDTLDLDFVGVHDELLILLLEVLDFVFSRVHAGSVEIPVLFQGDDTWRGLQDAFVTLVGEGSTIGGL
jgi:hypothetical protein